MVSYFSYFMPLSLLIVKGRSTLPKNRYINLGRAGLFINIIVIVSQTFVMVFLSFPMYCPITLSNMNWPSAVAAVAMVVGCINWFANARQHYCIPKPLFVAGLHKSPDVILTEVNGDYEDPVSV